MWMDGKADDVRKEKGHKMGEEQEDDDYTK